MTEAPGGNPTETTTGGVFPNVEAEVPSKTTDPLHITVHGTIERGFTTRYSYRIESKSVLRGKAVVCTEVKASLFNLLVTVGESARCGVNSTPGHHKNEEVIW